MLMGSCVAGIHSAEHESVSTDLGEILSWEQGTLGSVGISFLLMDYSLLRSL
jgi:hypothetical protein